MWAFGYGPKEASHLWDRIPLDADIVVTHTPPKYHCDERKDRRSVGCEELRNALWRVRPRLAICGHVHESRGVERIRWDLGVPNIKYKESNVQQWGDPGRDNKKMSLVDLTCKGGNAIDNDGSRGDYYQMTATSKPSQGLVPVSNASRIKCQPTILDPSQTSGPQINIATLASNVESMLPATRGQGGILPSQRCDLESLSGRLGRRETCVINAAIMASSWQHLGAKKFNKPIVVDIDLPVWEK